MISGQANSDAERQVVERAAGEVGVLRARREQAGKAKPHVAWRENKAGQHMAERAAGEAKVQQV
jgi:hypothetical protein